MKSKNKEFKSSTSTGTKIIFWLVIIVMVLGSIAGFSGLGLQGIQKGQVNTNTPNPQSTVASKSIEGTVKKVETGVSTESQYYLDVAGTPIALLVNSDKKINIGDYLDKDVLVQGKESQSSEQDGAVLDITSISTK